MKQHVILLRGINVGGHGKLPMKALCNILLNLGASNPRTYIQSGNVVVDSEICGEALSLSIEAAKGFKPQILVLSRAAFEKIAADIPISEPDGQKLHIWFTSGHFTFDQEKADTLRNETETLHITRNAIYLHAPNGIGRSKLAAKIEALAGIPCTARNLNTVKKLMDMLNTPA